MRNVASFLLMILLVSGAYAQGGLSKKEETNLLAKAEYYYEDDYNKNIPKALEYFEKLKEGKPNDPYYSLMVGICNTYFPDRKGVALDQLLAVKKKNSDFNEVNFYLGRAYAAKHQFDDAIKLYQEYLSGDGVGEAYQSITRQNIMYCQNAKKSIQDSLKIEIRNIGPPINTSYSEYVPVITPDESMMIFTHRGAQSKGGLMNSDGKEDVNGHYREDILVSYRLGDRWLEPESIDDNINTSGHDASIALSLDGQDLFIYKQTKKDQGDIYVSHLNGDEWSKPVRLKGDVNTSKWEGSATLSSDGLTLYFASERDGGLGGRDLYSARLQSDGSWRNIENLGPVINTELNEDSPFIHPDRRTLYYSSEGHNSMGGYDIFYTYLTDDNGWDVPEAVGYPVNTIDDDRYYVLSADAQTGYYSTAGRSKKGTHDIYVVSPGHFGKRPVLALIIGVTEADEEPIEADITVTNTNTGKLEGKFKSNSISGKYILALTPGNKYKIAIEIEGYETQVSYLDVESLDSYVQVEHDFKMYSKENVEGKSSDMKINELQNKIDEQVVAYKNEHTQEGHDQMVYNQILEEDGGKEKEGLEYFVDVTGSGLEVVDGVKVMSVKNTDGSTREVVGSFKTLLAAEVVRQKIMSENKNMEGVAVLMAEDESLKTVKEYYPERFTDVEDAGVDMHDRVTKREEVEALIEPKDEVGELIAEGGVSEAESKSISGLKFKVEIGAFDNPEDFTVGYLEKYGAITAKKYPDGKTRYTFGPFETLLEAENFKEMLRQKESTIADAFVTVFVFGDRKTVPEYAEGPCENDAFIDFSDFIGKDLNNKKIYNKLIRLGGRTCSKGLVFKVQIAAYRFPENYKSTHLKGHGNPKVVVYPDAIARFTLGGFNTLGEAEVLRQKVIKAGQKDAWVTPFYNGKRMLMEELIKANFYGRSLN